MNTADMCCLYSPILQHVRSNVHSTVASSLSSSSSSTLILGGLLPCNSIPLITFTYHKALHHTALIPARSGLVYQFAETATVRPTDHNSRTIPITNCLFHQLLLHFCICLFVCNPSNSTWSYPSNAIHPRPLTRASAASSGENVDQQRCASGATQGGLHNRWSKLAFCWDQEKW